MSLAPGRTICASVATASTSAVCCTSVPAIVAGLIEPESVKGVMQTAWPEEASSTTASVIGMSSCIGELVLTIAITAGSRASSSRVTP
jgi:hypothetical protein